MAGERDYVQQANELLEQAWLLGHCPEQVALAEEAVRLADAHGDVELGFQARELLIEAGAFAGFPEKALVAFTWNLAQCDRDPQRFSEQELGLQAGRIAGPVERQSVRCLAYAEDSVAELVAVRQRPNFVARIGDAGGGERKREPLDDFGVIRTAGQRYGVVLGPRAHVEKDQAAVGDGYLGETVAEPIEAVGR